MAQHVGTAHPATLGLRVTVVLGQSLSDLKTTMICMFTVTSKTITEAGSSLDL